MCDAQHNIQEPEAEAISVFRIRSYRTHKNYKKKFHFMFEQEFFFSFFWLKCFILVVMTRYGKAKKNKNKKFFRKKKRIHGFHLSEALRLTFDKFFSLWEIKKKENFSL